VDRLIPSDHEERDADATVIHAYELVGHTNKWQLRLINYVHVNLDSADPEIDS
jgi:hypothetical protein